MTDPTALDPRRDRHRLGRGLPRRDDRQRRPARRSGASCRPRSSGVLEGQAYVVSGYLAVLAALLILAGALSDHYGRRRVYAIGLAGFGAHLRAVRAVADARVADPLPARSRAPPGRCSCPGSLSLITQTFEGAERGRAFGIWAASTSALTVLGPIVGGVIVDTIGWRFAFLINVPLLALALWVTVRHVAESRDDEASGRFDWLGRRRRRAGRRRSGVRADPRPGAGLGRSARPGSRSRSGSSRSSSSRSSWPGARTRSSRSSLFRQRAFATINLATFFIYGALYVTISYQALVLQGVLGYTALGAGAVGLPTGILLSVLSTRIGTLAGRLGRPPLPGRRAAADGRRPCSGTRACPPTRQPGRPPSRRPATLVPPLDAWIDVDPGGPAVRRRDLAGRRAADEHADGLDPERASPGSGRRSTTPSRGSGSRSSARSSSSRSAPRSTPALGSSRPGLDTADPASAAVPAAQSAGGRRDARPGRGGHQASIDAFHLAMLASRGACS